MKSWSLKYWLVLLANVFIAELVAENDAVNCAFEWFRWVAWLLFSSKNPFVFQPGGTFCSYVDRKMEFEQLQSFVDFENIAFNINGKCNF